MRACVAVGVSLVVLAGVPAGAHAQSEPFARALRNLHDAVQGTYGDEGRSLESRVDAVSESLAAWDRSIRTREAAIRAEMADAAPAARAGLHATLAGMFLARARLVDALSELDAARQLAPEAGFEQLRGIALEAMGRTGAAGAAFRNASSLDPDDPVSAYLALTRSEVDDATAERLQQTLSRAQQGAMREGRQAPPNPFPVVPSGLAGEQPVFPLARYAAGFELHLRGQHAQGISVLKKAIASDPLVVDPAVQTDEMRGAGAALRQGEIAAARETLAALVQRLPGSSEAHRLFAAACDLSGDLDLAIQHLETAIRLRPDDERSWLALVRIRTAAAEVPALVRTLEDAVAAVPRSGELHWQLAGLARSRDDGGTSLEHYAAAARLPVLAGAGEVHGWVFELAMLLEDADRAIEAARQRIRVAPDDPAAHRSLARLYTTQGRHDEAFHELATAVWLDPDDPLTLSALGLNHLAGRRDVEAVEALERAVALSPGSREPRYALAQALMRLGRRDEAREHLAVFERLHVEWMGQSRRAHAASALEREAALLTSSGQHLRAANAWREVVALEPQVAQHYVSLAGALGQGGRHEAALRALANAAAIRGVAELHLRIYEVLMRLGRTTESALALATYQRLRLEDLRRSGR